MEEAKGTIRYTRTVFASFLPSTYNHKAASCRPCDIQAHRSLRDRSRTRFLASHKERLPSSTLQAPAVWRLLPCLQVRISRRRWAMESPYFRCSGMR